MEIKCLNINTMEIRTLLLSGGMDIQMEDGTLVMIRCQLEHISTQSTLMIMKENLKQVGSI